MKIKTRVRAGGAFRNVEGLDSETEVVEYQDGPDLVIRR